MSAVILGMGNPLLDISDTVSEDVLAKYGLEANNAVLAEEKHLPLYAELAKQPKVQYIAGGATQNSIRVAQWMMQEPGKTAYMGCVGDDEYSKKMNDVMKADGVDARYMVDPTTATGTCAVCITGKNRSLVANLSAANNFKQTHIQKDEHKAVVENAKIIYSAGFFITVSPASMKIAWEAMAKSGSIYCLNLSAPFLMQVPPFKAVFVEALPYVDYLFGNETEALTWAETEGWETKDIGFIATRLSLIPMAKAGHRHVVITQGAEQTLVAYRGNVTTYSIVPLAADKIVDTNGAGDAYVGGFLAALAKGKSTEECHKAGAHSACAIIQVDGCACIGSPGYKW
jgi:adenosine kinase